MELCYWRRFNLTNPLKSAKALLLTTVMGASIYSTAFAYQPRFVVQGKSELSLTGYAREIKGVTFLKNNFNEPVLVKVTPIRSNDFEFKFDVENRELNPGEELKLFFTGALLKDGKYQILAKVEFFNKDGVLKVGSHTLDLYFNVENGKYKVASYEELYMRPTVIDPKMGASFVGMIDKGEIPRSRDFEIKKPIIDEMIKLDRENINRISLNSGLIRGNIPIPDRPIIIDRPIRIPDRPIVNPMSLSETLGFKNLKSGTTVTGTFSYKGMDNMLHPAFGWRVRAWKQIIFGIWTIVAEDWIQGNGSWTLNVPNGPGNVQFQYVAFNRFFTPQNSAGDTYRWVGPVRAPISGSTFNEGSWIANTADGSARGLGEIYDEGMRLWSKLYYAGGINPLRSSSIKVIFPNTTYDCGDGTGVPWSCANTGGTIWLIPSHASRNGVMTHELSHQINYEYWGGSLPSGSGGSHNLTNCYTKALAMTEGFANFMVFWTQAERGATPDAGFDFAVENPSFACTTLEKNESWVAAALWDLHDSHFDVNDNLWFINEGAVPAIYLRNGMKNSLSEFYPFYRNAANTEHRTIIDNIFKQNHIIP